MLTNADLQNGMLERINRKYANLDKKQVSNEQKIANLVKGKTYSGRNEIYKDLNNNLGIAVYKDNRNAYIKIENETFIIITKKCVNGYKVKIVWNITTMKQIEVSA